MMSANSIRCFACKGQKEVTGMGGIVKKCDKCNGVGRVDTQVETSSPTAAIEVVAKVAPKRKSRVRAKPTVDCGTADMFQDTVTIKEVFTKKLDPLIEAVLAEPRMKPEEWQATYKNVPGLFGKDIATGAPCEAISKVQRAQMRAQYAQSQPKIKRKVDMTKAQDISGDIANVN